MASNDIALYRTVAVCGSFNFERDAWLFSDLVLLRAVLPHSEHDTYLTCVNLEKAHRVQSLRLHGHPAAERLVLPDPEASWITKCKKKELKQRFLAVVRNAVKETKVRDRLIVAIVGHGIDGGAIGLGEHRRLYSPSHPKLLQPIELLDLLRDCVGGVTLLLNSCHSGEWHIAARGMGLCLEPESGGITIISTGYNQEVIYSHPESASEHYRGSYFMNVVTGELYKDYDLFLPRPQIIEGQSTRNYFPQSNISQSASTVVRTRTSNITDFTSNIGRDLSVLRTPNSEPTMSPTPQPNTPATMIFGVKTTDDLPLRINTLAPASPSIRYDAVSLTGSLGDRIRIYLELPLGDGTAGSSVYVSQWISQTMRGTINYQDRRKLKKVLKSRIQLYHAALGFIQSNMLENHWPTHPTALDEASYMFIAESQHLHTFTMQQIAVITPWNDVRNLVITCMQRAGVTPQQFDAMMERRWADIRSGGGPQNKGSKLWGWVKKVPS
ncbi:hypothetical protein BGX38DRAFT_1265682 [Terfezia claveryi]|nr:hypothetical protein BGX38DRAFT_1265682 [Terfezia claveryi]